MKRRTRSHYNRSLVLSSLIGVFACGLAVAQDNPARPTEGSKIGKTHSEKMKEEMPPHLESEVADRVHSRLFDVESQIETTRVILGRLRAVTAHGHATGSQKEQVELHRKILSNLGEVKMSLATVHVEIAECIAECARFEARAAKGELGGAHDHTAHDHHEKMRQRTTKAVAALKKLHDAVVALTKLEGEVEDEDLGRLISYLSRECDALWRTIRVCEVELELEPTPHEGHGTTKEEESRRG